MSHSSFSIFLSFPGLVDSMLLNSVPLVPTSIILSIEYWVQVNTSPSCSATIKSSLEPEESLKGSFPSHPALLLFLLSSSFHAFPHSEPFPTSLVGEVTRLSEEGLSLPSLDLGERRVNENSCESSEIELRVWE